MANARVTYGRRSRVPGTQVGVQVNTFGMQRLMVGVTGEALADIALESMKVAYEEAHANWAVLTGASRDSIELAKVEVTARSARVVLRAGGQRLKDDPRNKSHKDYAPYLEFNGSPSGSQAPGVLSNAVYGNDSAIRGGIHTGISELIRSLTGE